MRGFEDRLRRLEGHKPCPLCEEARRALLESIVSEEPGTAPRYCGGCGQSVRLRIEEVDAILQEAGGGGGR